MTEPVLVLNAGSSSVKYRLLDPSDGAVLASGLVERIGEQVGRLEHRVGGAAPHVVEGRIDDHEAALAAVLDAFDQQGPRLRDAGIRAVAHRVVHGGERFVAPTLLDDEIVAAIADLSVLAPLHNPPSVEGIRVARRALPALPHVAVFDTAFHRTLPPHAFSYAVPREWAAEHGVRRYGFHGTSVAWVTREAARLLGRRPDEVDLVVLHLGNGASATAVRAGRSVDTSMGLTPLEGLVMGTRSGDVDPALAAHLSRTAGLSAEQVEQALNRDSGLRGLAGSNDVREVLARAAAGDPEARLALDVYCYRLRKYVGAYAAALGRLDAVVFTAGVGEHAAAVREQAMAGLGLLGIAIDRARNESDAAAARWISPDGAPVAVLVVPTDEEREMARQALEVVGGR